MPTQNDRLTAAKKARRAEEARRLLMNALNDQVGWLSPSTQQPQVNRGFTPVDPNAPMLGTLRNPTTTLPVSPSQQQLRNVSQVHRADPAQTFGMEYTPATHVSGGFLKQINEIIEERRANSISFDNFKQTIPEAKFNAAVRDGSIWRLYNEYQREQMDLQKANRRQGWQNLRNTLAPEGSTILNNAADLLRPMGRRILEASANNPVSQNRPNPMANIMGMGITNSVPPTNYSQPGQPTVGGQIAKETLGAAVVPLAGVESVANILNANANETPESNFGRDATGGITVETNAGRSFKKGDWVKGISDLVASFFLDPVMWGLVGASAVSRARIATEGVASSTAAKADIINQTADFISVASRTHPNEASALEVALAELKRASMANEATGAATRNVRSAFQALDDVVKTGVSQGRNADIELSQLIKNTATSAEEYTVQARAAARPPATGMAVPEQPTSAATSQALPHSRQIGSANPSAVAREMEAQAQIARQQATRAASEAANPSREMGAEVLNEIARAAEAEAVAAESAAHAAKVFARASNPPRGVGLSTFFVDDIRDLSTAVKLTGLESESSKLLALVNRYSILRAGSQASSNALIKLTQHLMTTKAKLIESGNTDVAARIDEIFRQIDSGEVTTDIQWPQPQPQLTPRNTAVSRTPDEIMAHINKTAVTRTPQRRMPPVQEAINASVRSGSLTTEQAAQVNWAMEAGLYTKAARALFGRTNIIDKAAQMTIGKLQEVSSKWWDDVVHDFANEEYQFMAGNSRGAKASRFVSKNFVSKQRKYGPEMMQRIKNRQVLPKQAFKDVHNINKAIESAESAKAITQSLRMNDFSALTEEEKFAAQFYRDQYTKAGYDASELGLLDPLETLHNAPTYVPDLYDVYEFDNVGSLLQGIRKRADHKGSALKMIGDRFLRKKKVVTQEEFDEMGLEYIRIISSIKSNATLSATEKEDALEQVIDEYELWRSLNISDAWKEAHRIDDIRYISGKTIPELIQAIETRRMQNFICNQPEYNLNANINMKIFGETPGKFTHSWTVEDIQKTIDHIRNTMKTETNPATLAQLTEEANKRQAVVDNILNIVDHENSRYVQVPSGTRKGRKYGTLSGTFIRKDVFDDLDFFYQSFSEFESLLSVISLPNSIFKINKAIMNPGTHARNIYWNIFMYHMGGGSPMDLKLALRAGLILAGKAPVGDNALMKLAEQTGLMDGDFTSEYKLIMQEWLPAIESGMSGNNSLLSVASKVALQGKRIATIPQRMYAAEEHFFKMMLFIKELDKTSNPMDAAKIVQDHFIDYNATSNALKTYTRNPFAGGPFSTFYVKTFQDLPDKLTHHPTRVLPWIILFSTLIPWFYKKRFSKEAYEKYERFKPKWFKGTKFPMTAPFNYDEATDTTSAFDFTSWMPFSDAVGNPDDMGMWGFAKPLHPFNNPTLRAAIELRTNKSLFTGEKIFPDRTRGLPQPDPETIDEIRRDYYWKLYAPSLAPPIRGISQEGGYGWRKIARAWRGENIDARGQTLLQSILDVGLGFKTFQVNPQSAQWLIIGTHRQLVDLNLQIAEIEAEEGGDQVLLGRLKAQLKATEDFQEENYRILGLETNNGQNVPPLSPPITEAQPQQQQPRRPDTRQMPTNTRQMPTEIRR